MTELNTGNAPAVDTLPITPEELLTEVVFRLRDIALVLQREHDWLLPKVQEARADFEEGVKFGFKTEEFDGGWDDLLLKSRQVDKHLDNIRNGAEFVADIADTLKLAFSFKEKVAS